MKNIILKVFILLLFCASAYGQKEASPQLPIVKLYIKNFANHKFRLQYYSDFDRTTLVVDSGIVKSNNDSLVFKGIMMDEEAYYVLFSDVKYSFHVILAKNTVTEIHFDVAEFEKNGKLDYPEFTNYPSSADWNKLMFGTGAWKRRTNYLNDSLNFVTDIKVKSSIVKEIDSLNDVIVFFIKDNISKTHSIQVISTGLLKLKSQNDGKPYTELIDSLEKAYPNSVILKNRIESFREYKYSEEPVNQRSLSLNTIAPDFNFTTLDGLNKSLSAYKGYYVLLDFGRVGVRRVGRNLLFSRKHTNNLKTRNPSSFRFRSIRRKT